MPAGRPTLYREEYCQQVIDVCSEGYSLTGFAGLIGVSRDTIDEWQRVHAEFSAAVDRAKAIRLAAWEKRAMKVGEEGGSGGQSTMITFMLKNHAPHEFREKQEIEHSGNLSLEALVSQSLEKPKG